MQQLTDYKTLIDADLAAYSHQLLDNSELQYGANSRTVLEAYCDILSRGGKRLRGALVMAGYQMTGGQDEPISLQAARIIEMIHAYVLIIDDITDRSDLRRGGPTAHRLLEEYHRRHGLHGNSGHFGVAQAINAALAGGDLARRELGGLAVPAEVKLEALNNLQDNLVTTVHGQIHDVFNEALQDVAEAEVRDVLSWKTAYYTFLNPLNFGIILNGGSPADCQRLLDYSLHAGLSFQITDDIIGMFGDERNSGKSAEDDLKEGKVTLLIARALGHATPAEKQLLVANLGNRQLTVDDYRQCRQIIEDSGALHYARGLAESHAAKAVAALDELPSGWSRESIGFLEGLAGYITHRTA